MPKSQLKEVFAANIRRVVESQQASQNKLSERGAPQKNISNAVRGGNVTLDTVEGIAHALGIAAWKLFIPNLDPAEAKPFHTVLCEAYDAAPENVQRSIRVLLKIQPLDSQGESAIGAE